LSLHDALPILVIRLYDRRTLAPETVCEALDVTPAGAKLRPQLFHRCRGAPGQWPAPHRMGRGGSGSSPIGVAHMSSSRSFSVHSTGSSSISRVTGSEYSARAMPRSCRAGTTSSKNNAADTQHPTGRAKNDTN